jgi:hypothetical protein
MGYQKRKLEERNKLVTDAQRAVNIYKDLIESVGGESEAPHDAPVVDFMEWLANEMATVNDYMTIGQEYASFVSLRTFAQALEECGCAHLEKFEIKDPQSYWNAPRCAHEAGQRFFKGLWHPRGRDLTLLRATMSHGKVSYFLFLFAGHFAIDCVGMVTIFQNLSCSLWKSVRLSRKR